MGVQVPPPALPSRREEAAHHASAPALWDGTIPQNTQQDTLPPSVARNRDGNPAARAGRLSQVLPNRLLYATFEDSLA